MIEIEYDNVTDLEEILEHNRSYTGLCVIFGNREAEEAVYDEICCRSFKCDDEVEEAFEDSYHDIVANLSEQRMLTLDDLDYLDISVEDAEKFGISVTERKVNDAGETVETFVIQEDPRQGLLFPDMEKDLPPYRRLVERVVEHACA